MSLISDGELRRQLQKNGVDVGPITDSTRGVYQKKLSSLKGKKYVHSTASKRKVLPGPAPLKPAFQVSIAGVKRQRVTPLAADRQVGPTNKRSRLDSFDNHSPRVQPTKLVEVHKEFLYPDLSEYFPDHPPLANSHPLSSPEPLPACEVPRQPQHLAPKPNPPADSPSSHSQPSSFHPDLHSCNSQSSEDSSSSFESPHSSQSSMVETVTPKSPVLLPEPKEKGLLEVVTDFLGSRVSRLLNVSGLSISPRRKLSERDSSSSDRRIPSGSHPRNVAYTDLDAPSVVFPKRYDWELEPSDVILCKRRNGELWRLGKGGFGEVFKGVKDAIDEVAVKRIPLENNHCSVIEQFKKEIDMISKLRHRHIVQFYGACIQPQHCYMVTELMDNDLFSIMRSPHEAEQYKWCGVYGKGTLIGVASGLHYLHSRTPPVVHRDIKSPNILVMDGLAKIADVGIARTMGNADMTAQNGFSMAWAAPEVVYRRRATEKIDIWSLGVIIWEVVSGRLPRPGKLVLPSNSPPYLHSLYLQCINDNPTKRPSALEVTAELRRFQE